MEGSVSLRRIRRLFPGRFVVLHTSAVGLALAVGLVVDAPHVAVGVDDLRREHAVR